MTTNTTIPHWKELNDIFLNFRKYTPKIKQQLESIGYKVTYNSNHPMLTFYVNGKECHVTFSSSPSDNYAGKQILRQIRRFYK